MEIDSFLSDLETFATGSYLREEERELWDAPFDPGALPELRRIMEEYSARVHGGEEPVAATRQFMTAIEKFNRDYQYAVIEPEEEAELNEFIAQVTAGKVQDGEEVPNFS